MEGGQGRTVCVVALAAILTAGAVLGSASGLVWDDASSSQDGAEWEGPYNARGVDSDSPNDGYYDYLLAEGILNVSRPGEFSIFASVLGRSSFAQYGFFEVGRHHVQVPIDGYWLRSTGQSGPYLIELLAQNLDYSLARWVTFYSGPFSPWDFEEVDIEVAGAIGDGAVDLDDPPNGLYDVLAIEVPVLVRETGFYQFNAFVSGTVGVWANNQTPLDSGFQVVRLDLSGFRLREGQVDGPARVSIYLSAQNAWSGTERIEYETRPYQWTMFEGPPVALGGTPDYTPIDAEDPPDGLYDALELGIPVSASRPGEYRLQADLRDMAQGRLLGAQESVIYLERGSTSVTLRVPSAGIAGAKIDGPYQLTFSVSNFKGEELFWGKVETVDHRWTEFDLPTLAIERAGPVHDEFRDLEHPADGAIDLYVAKIPVTVWRAGYFHFTGTLTAKYRQFHTTNFTHLPAGPGWVELAWPAATFARWWAEATAPLYVHGGSVADVGYLYTTYNASEPPVGMMVSRADLSLGRPLFRLPDADGDGLFDRLDAEVPIQVERGGFYSFGAFLQAAYHGPHFTWAANHTRLEPGNQTLRLSFPGWAIRASLADGPYTFVLQYDAGGYPRAYDFSLNANLMVASTPLLLHHQFGGPRPSVQAGIAGSAPRDDGNLSVGEWQGATIVDLTTGDPGAIPAKALVFNDNTSLYVALDVVGDTTEDVIDGAALAFDVRSLDRPNPGSDNQVGTGLTVRGLRRQFRAIVDPLFMSSGDWSILESPPEATAPAVRNLTVAVGFGPSELEAQPHRIYEFRIPLALLEARPGDTLGFAVHSTEVRGIVDGSLGRASAWPVTSLSYTSLALNNFARLSLARPSAGNEPPRISVTIPSPGAVGSGGESIAGTADDGAGEVAWVEVKVDDGPWRRAEGTAAWTLELDTTGLVDGPHVITARAYDGEFYSAEVQVLVVIDNSPPTLSVIAPRPGSTLESSTIDVEWIATDPTTGIEKYEVSLDGGQAIVLSPSQVRYRFEGVGDGGHTVTVAAYDGAGNPTVTQVRVKVTPKFSNPRSLSDMVPTLTLGVAVAVAGTLTLLLWRRRRD